MQAAAENNKLTPAPFGAGQEFVTPKSLQNLNLTFGGILVELR